ncbi:pilus assembly PilX family protein [Alkalimarinus sediminis]|uniref:PilX N-terminal domain-containing pilus assembly protein n=1 Tax=Alkalimarinus sediminis TaxID=1632866 RepID=A0A9E8HJM6_9ALTE|nr:PilX N-terminal domain-containing pilus assembly protein [Alkalimarinus sediminis]UZW73893.1 PilX N-terminal domain-containing pilus assembly protein [Alkalimarinus sediminis]
MAIHNIDGTHLKRQKGIALFITLVMLLIMTLLALYSMQGTILEEKMSGNSRDRSMAFQAAEAALRSGEAYLAAQTIIPTSSFTSTGNADGLWTQAAAGASPRWEANIWSDNTKSKAVSTSLSGLASNPRYIIEYITEVVEEEDKVNLQNIGETTGSGSVNIYRITAYGVGGSANARVLLQTTYGKKI